MYPLFDTSLGSLQASLNTLFSSFEKYFVFDQRKSATMLTIIFLVFVKPFLKVLGCLCFQYYEDELNISDYYDYLRCEPLSHQFTNILDFE